MKEAAADSPHAMHFESAFKSNQIKYIWYTNESKINKQMKMKKNSNMYEKKQH